ncbi:MAG: M23 family metallopeptidase [Acidobacteria bacterium]|nr:M23 family metallopeptidase [Acidobacteriota bacterium]
MKKLPKLTQAGKLTALTLGSVFLYALVRLNQHPAVPLAFQAGLASNPCQTVAPKVTEPEITWFQGHFETKKPFFNQMLEIGLTGGDVHAITQAFKGTFDFRKAKPEHEWTLGFQLERALTFKLMVSPVEQYSLDLSQSPPLLSSIEIPVINRTEFFQVRLESSLFEAFDHCPQSAQLAAKITALFAWDIDFFQDPRKGDQIEVLVETRYVNVDGNPVFHEYGAIQAARYFGARDTYQAFLFHDESGKDNYYNEKGESVIKSMLRSPLKFERVTSRFRKDRFHPILKTKRPHNGVDYGAPLNTPVMAVADGKVLKAGRFGGAGNMVELQHRNSMQTQYMHLNKFASGVKAGARVKQGQIIGYVGKTGYATAEHLHYGMKINGRYVDPLKQKVQPGTPLAKNQRAAFTTKVQQYQCLIEACSVSQHVVQMARR